jgi:hypothetical protein
MRMLDAYSKAPKDSDVELKGKRFGGKKRFG